MGRLRRGWIGCICALPVAAAAQSAPIVGAESIDTITVHGPAITLPLRHGDIIPNSERVHLNGQTLRRGIDYAINNTLGLVTLTIARKAGDTARVIYRYDQSKVTQAAPAAPASLGFDLLGQTDFGLVGGFGLTQHTSGGRTVTANLLGFRHNFAFKGQGSMKGLVLFSDETSSMQGMNGFAEGEQGMPGMGLSEGRRSRFVVENLKTKAMGGSVEASYQQIGDNFNGFDTVRGSGFDQAATDQLQKEKGLTRYGFGFNDIGVGGMKLTDGMKVVRDGKSSITWQNMGFKMGGLSLNYTGRKIDSQFARFDDLADADKAQMAGEAGLKRTNLTGDFKGGAKSDLGFTSMKVEDDQGHKIERQEYTYTGQLINFKFGNQSFDPAFVRLANLTPDERARFALDTGLKRQWEDVQLGFLGAKASPLHLSAYSVESPTGAFHAQDLSVGFKGLSIAHTERNVDPNFHSIAQLQPAEIDASVANIASMYDPTLKPAPPDRAMFVASSGVDRSGWRISAQPTPAWTLGFSTMGLKGATDRADFNVLNVSGKDFLLHFQEESIGKNFNELPTLMTFEQQRLGLITGLNKMNFGLDTKLFGDKVSFNGMKANSPLGGADRATASVTGKNIDFSLTSHDVDKNFTNVNMLVDPENNVLLAMLGQKGTDAKLKWQPTKTLNVNAESLNQTGDGIDQDRKSNAANFTWTPNKHTELGYQYIDDKSDNALDLLYFRKLQRWTLKQDLGKNSTFRYAEENEQLAGTTSTTPSDHKAYFQFQTALNATTKFTSERNETHYDNGASQTVMTNTLSAQLSPKAGVSVTDVRAANQGVVSGATATPDTSHADYGVWLILPNGMKLSYGDVRNTNGSDEDDKKTLAITPGQLGNLKVDSASQTDHYWDNALDPNHNQTATNINLSTVKPFRFGPLSNMHFNFGLNAAQDRTTWTQENRLIGVSGKFGSNTFEYDYKGQMWTNGYRAIDRLYKFATDQKPNRLLTASIAYKVRTLPWEEQDVIRDLSFTLRPAKNFEVSNHMITNPEIPDGNALLGTTAQAARSSEWKIDYKRDPNLSFGGAYSELVNHTSLSMSRTAGLQATMFSKKGSPLKLFYGLQQIEAPGILRNSQSRFSAQFDQKPGPNQSFSFFISNLSYGDAITAGQLRNNWTVRLDYGLKFN